MPSQDVVNYRQRYVNQVDGFAYNAAVTSNPYSYQALAIASMGAMRNANNYRPRVFCVPDQTVYGLTNSSGGGTAGCPEGIPPFTDFITQVRMVPGTIVLGMALTNIDFIFNAPGEAAFFLLANNFYVSVTDDGTGLPYFSGWASEMMFNTPTLTNDLVNTNRDAFIQKTVWFPLACSRPVLDPGILTVTFCYKGRPPVSGGTAGSGNIAPQVLLHCAEPCPGTFNSNNASQECA